MHVVNSTAQLPKAAAYGELQQQLAAVFAGERNGLANTANMSALLYEALPNLNWVGFYFLQAGELVLGPFQGKVACVRIALGRGVCGTAAERRETIIVPDVTAFSGHIVCYLIGRVFRLGSIRRLVALHGDVDGFTRSVGIRIGKPTRRISWLPTRY